MSSYLRPMFLPLKPERVKQFFLSIKFDIAYVSLLICIGSGPIIYKRIVKPIPSDYIELKPLSQGVPDHLSSINATQTTSRSSANLNTNSNANLSTNLSTSHLNANPNQKLAVKALSPSKKIPNYQLQTFPTLLHLLNRGSAAEISRLKGIGPSTAADIVSYRTHHGPFLSVKGLIHVKGIGSKTLTTIQQSFFRARQPYNNDAQTPTQK